MRRRSILSVTHVDAPSPSPSPSHSVCLSVCLPLCVCISRLWTYLVTKKAKMEINGKEQMQDAYSNTRERERERERERDESLSIFHYPYVCIYSLIAESKVCMCVRGEKKKERKR